MLNAKQIISFLDENKFVYEIKGDITTAVETYAPLNALVDGSVTWVKNWSPETEAMLSERNDLIVVCREDGQINDNGRNCYILCAEPKMIFFEILGAFFAEERTISGIADSARVSTNKIGVNCSIGEYSVIGEQVELGDDVVIGNNVTITGKVKIGKYSTICSGCVIGKAGFGFYTAQDGHKKRVPHLGGVIIGDYVEIGANTCIDCGTMGDTIVGSYVKIDNLCHIGHNAQIGNGVMIITGVAIGGSCVLEEGSYVGPGSVIKNQLHLGKDSFVGMQTVVVRDVKQDESVFGVPGRAFPRDYKV